MLNSQSESLSVRRAIGDSNLISVVLLTQNAYRPTFQPPEQVNSSIPKGMPKEIVVVHYNFLDEYGSADNDPELSNEQQIEQNEGERVMHSWVKTDFASAVKRGIEESCGKFVLVMDADNAYSKEIVPELIEELMENLIYN